MAKLEETCTYIYPKNNKGQRIGNTLCVIFRDGHYYYGESLCSKGDNFNKATGRKLAFERAEEAYNKAKGRRHSDKANVRTFRCTETFKGSTSVIKATVNSSGTYLLRGHKDDKEWTAKGIKELFKAVNTGDGFVITTAKGQRVDLNYEEMAYLQHISSIFSKIFSDEEVKYEVKEE